MKRALVFGVVPIAVVIVGVAVEYFLIGDSNPRFVLQGKLNDVIKHSLSLETSLSQMVTGLATAVVGAAAYYFRTRRKSDVQLGLSTKAVSALLIVILFSACASIYFGQLWMAALRDQLIHDYVDFTSSSVVWPERLQSGFFLISLVWFAELVYLTERTPPEPPAEPVQSLADEKIDD